MSPFALAAAKKKYIYIYQWDRNGNQRWQIVNVFCKLFIFNKQKHTTDFVRVWEINYNICMFTFQYLASVDYSIYVKFLDVVQERKEIG